MQPTHMQFLALTAGGAVVGALAGWLTRPSFMGVPMPLSLLSSNVPADAPFKAELSSHLMISIGIGAIAGAILFAVVYTIMAQRRT